MSDLLDCCCGHLLDEHVARGDDAAHPESTECEVDDCPCFMFDPNPEEKTDG